MEEKSLGTMLDMEEPKARLTILLWANILQLMELARE